MDFESCRPSPPFEHRPQPLSLSAFEALRRDKNWHLSEVYPDTFEAVHDPLAKKVVGGGGKVHYLLKKTGRSAVPYLLYGPFVGDMSRLPWPSVKDIQDFRRQAGNQINRIRLAQALSGLSQRRRLRNPRVVERRFRSSRIVTD